MNMDETKLKKVNDRLYHAPRKNGEPSKWTKNLGGYIPRSLTFKPRIAWKSSDLIPF
jgi:hypothetical protein